MRLAFILRTVMLVVSSALATAGCAAPATNPSPTAAPAEATSPLVDFELGPHRFTLPANYFVDGGGPDFQGSVTLALHWPSLEPYPPGQPYASFTKGPMRNQRVIVSLDYIDRVPIDELPERHVTLRSGENADDPDNNIALRDRLPDRFGLEHYRTDLEKIALDQGRAMQRAPKPPETYSGRTFDWFIGRDAQGRVRTVVKCDDSRKPEGEEIRGEALVEIPGRTQSPQCGAHLFAMPEYSLAVRTGYSRPLLRDWQRIEATVRQVMHDAHRRANPASEGDENP